MVNPGSGGSEHLQQHTVTVSLACLKLLRLKASQVKTSSWLTKVKDLTPVLFIVRTLSLQQVRTELRFKIISLSKFSLITEGALPSRKRIYPV